MGYLTAYDVASHFKEFSYGLDRSKLADELRLLAARIESEDILIRRIHTIQVADRENYTVSRVVLEVVEKVRLREAP